MIEPILWIFLALLAGEGPVKLFGLWPTILVGTVLAIGLVGMARDAVRALVQRLSGLSKKEHMVLTLLSAENGLTGLELIERSHGVLKPGTIYNTIYVLEECGYVAAFFSDTERRRRYYITEDGMAALDKAPEG